MKLETIKLTELNPAEYNPREISKDEFEGLKESLKTFGQQENLIVNKDMTIISGHQRYEAMKALDWEVAVCNVVDLDKHQEKKLNVMMNSTAISGKYDDLKLAEILEELKLDDDYESLRLDVLEPLDLSDVEVEEDEAPEVSSEPPVSKLGEVYQLGRHRVMCGDSTDRANVELLMDGEKADMVFTDPPYGMFYEADWSTAEGEIGGRKSRGKKYDNVIGDHEDYDPVHIFDMFGYCKEIFLWGADYYAERVPNKNAGSWLVWDKTLTESADRGFGSNFELCWSKNRHKRDIARIKWQGFFGLEKDDTKTRVHPTQKPAELARFVFDKWAKDLKIVVDLFLGSGSTLIACEQTDRTCYGMELDPKYVDVIRKRYWKFVNDGNEEGWQEGTPKV